MRHNKRTKRFTRTTSHRIAMFRNMTTSLFRYERITTTLPKAKRVTLEQVEGAKGEAKKELGARRVHNIRLAARTVQDKEVLRRLFDVYGARYQGREGGYTRIYRIGLRPGDAAEMAIIELVDRGAEEAAAEEPKKKKKRLSKKA